MYSVPWWYYYSDEEWPPLVGIGNHMPPHQRLRVDHWEEEDAYKHNPASRNAIGSLGAEEPGIENKNKNVEHFYRFPSQDHGGT